MPTSEMQAVPPSRMRASAVGMCVCVPKTTLTRPSRCQPMAIFSLEASAWKSTTRTLTSAGISASTWSIAAQGESFCPMYICPRTQATATRAVSDLVGRTVHRLPAARGERLAGRTICSVPLDSSGTISLLR